MALTDVKVRTAKPADKGYKLTDGEGMHLYVHSNGSKYWRLQYCKYPGKKTHSLSEIFIHTDMYSEEI
ncbi:Arm DNA-binding domain-containing protein, partial [Morganella morganii]|uniref:Arm DNA-binding domain-containing protein n=1 Tax=Morganella morganii TaxID=582 RepID=UPI0034E5267B